MKFSLYDTTNTDPLLAGKLVQWGPDPLRGEFDPQFEWDGRGVMIPTLGGVIYQDYGVKTADRKIKIAGQDMGDNLRRDILGKYNTLDTEWHLSDGLGNVWKVRFRRTPRGFMAVPDMILWAAGLAISNPPPLRYQRFRYEIIFLVVSQPQGS